MQNKELLAEFEEKRQALWDALEYEQERRSLAEDATAEARECQVQAESLAREEAWMAAQLEAERKSLALEKLAASQDLLAASQDLLAASQDQLSVFQAQLATTAAPEAELLAQIERLQHPER